MIPIQPVKNLKKRDVRLGQGFKETPFFGRTGLGRMTDKGQMGVKDNGKNRPAIHFR
jgi:hypothetical protein